MAPPLAELTAQAQTLSSAGDLAGARALLDRVLRDANADPRRATADLAIAAALHARVLIALGDPQTARLWAAFAHAAEERLHGPRDERTIAAAATHAAVLQQIGQHGRAALVYHDLVGELARLDGPDAPRVLAAEADLAIAEHASGHCGPARARLARAWRHHRDAYGDAAPAGIKMLARLGAMERECGRDREAAEHLALAHELSTRYLPSDHPLAAQAARLATARPTGRHTCGRRDEVGGTPFRPFPRRPAVTDPGPPHPAAHPVPPHGTPPTSPPPPRRGTAPASSPAAKRGTPPTSPPPPGRGTPSPDDPLTDPGGRIHRVGDDPHAEWIPDADHATGRDGAADPPLYLSDLHRLPGDPTGRHARPDMPAPLPGGRATGHDAGRPAPAEAAAPVPGKEPRPARSARPLLLAAVLAGGVAAAAAVVILTFPDDRDAGGARAGSAAPVAPAASTPTDSAPGDSARNNSAPGDSARNNSAPGDSAPEAARSGTATSEPGAPRNVRLLDSGDSVSLRWEYPRGAGGVVHLLAGRDGEQPRKFQELPAGAADYVVYNLSAGANYCFQVAVEYAPDRIAGAAPVCTRR